MAKSRDGRDVIDLAHTFVPPAGRGKGLAGKLCRSAFAHAKAEGFLVRPTCSYVSDTFIKRHPEFAEQCEPPYNKL